MLWKAYKAHTCFMRGVSTDVPQRDAVRYHMGPRATASFNLAKTEGDFNECWELKDASGSCLNYLVCFS